MDHLKNITRNLLKSIGKKKKNSDGAKSNLSQQQM